MCPRDAGSKGAARPDASGHPGNAVHGQAWNAEWSENGKDLISARFAPLDPMGVRKEKPKKRISATCTELQRQKCERPFQTRGFCKPLTVCLSPKVSPRGTKTPQKSVQCPCTEITCLLSLSALRSRKTPRVRPQLIGQMGQSVRKSFQAYRSVIWTRQMRCHTHMTKRKQKVLPRSSYAKLASLISFRNKASVHHRDAVLRSS